MTSGLLSIWENVELVFVSYVRFEAISTNGRVGTVLALEWLGGIRVAHDVACESAIIAACIVAVGALERSLVCVDAAVDLEARVVVETSAAFIAFERPLVGVDASMSFEVTRFDEALRAEGALEFGHAMESLRMASETPLLLETLLANVAREGLLAVRAGLRVTDDDCCRNGGRLPSSAELAGHRDLDLVIRTARTHHLKHDVVSIYTEMKGGQGPRGTCAITRSEEEHGSSSARSPHNSGS